MTTTQNVSMSSTEPTVRTMTTLISYIPCSLIVHGRQFVRCLIFDSFDVTTYEDQLQNLIDDIYDVSEPETKQEWQSILKSLEGNLMRQYRFWMDNIFTPLSKKRNLPRTSICYCEGKQGCRYDFFRNCHYKVNGEQWRVDLAGERPTISYNCASRTPEQILSLLRYYELYVDNHLERPKRKCCVISLPVLDCCTKAQTVTHRVIEASSNRVQ